jgi:GNAT superfamily N-acetyltransferase
MEDWKLTQERLDQIIFAMENQQTTFHLDMETGAVISRDKIVEDQIGVRYYELPLWRSLEGFQLMEKFVADLRNPIFREELREALASGKGVFRSFKNAIKQRRELERLWFSYKEDEMKRIVMEWLNEIREVEGLEKLELPEEDTEELIASDFVLSENVAEHAAAIQEHDLWAFFQAYPAVEKDRVREHHRLLRTEFPGIEDKTSMVIVAETPTGDFAGFVWAHEKESIIEAGPVIELIQLVVAEEYQGLGLAGVLLRRLIQKADTSGAAKVQIHLSGRFLDATKLFQKAGFHISAQSMELDLSRWQEGQE